MVPLPSMFLTCSYLFPGAFAPSDTKLSGSCSKNILWHICVDNNLRSAGTRKQLAKNIISWVSAAKDVALLFSDNVFKRSRVDPSSIELPDHPALGSPADSGDESIETESSTEEDLRFQRRLEETDHAFNEHRISGKGIGRLGVQMLRAMCGTRELEEDGKKDELVERLIHWVTGLPSPATRYADDLSSAVQLFLIRRNRALNQEKSSGKTFWRLCGTI